VLLIFLFMSNTVPPKTTTQKTKTMNNTEPPKTSTQKNKTMSVTHRFSFLC
jgi:hypothetical protein